MYKTEKTKNGFVFYIWLMLIISMILFSSLMLNQTVKGEPYPTLTITTRNHVHESQIFQVNVTSNSTPIVNATVTFFGSIQITNSSGQAIFTTPSITSSDNTTYTITASKEGYESATVTIIIIHHPRLLVNLSKNDAINEGESFIVCVYDQDTNLTVQNATVIFNGIEYFTDSEGMATLIAPRFKDEEYQNYYIFALKPGYIDSEPQIVRIQRDLGVNYSYLFYLFFPALLILLIFLLFIVLIYNKSKTK
jgi:hypothetical protein